MVKVDCSAGGVLTPQRGRELVSACHGWEGTAQEVRREHRSNKSLKEHFYLLTLFHKISQSIVEVYKKLFY